MQAEERWVRTYDDPDGRGPLHAFRRRNQHWRIPSLVEPMLSRIGAERLAILDLGCDGGWEFLNRFGAVTGLDRRASARQQATRAYGRAVGGDAVRLPFRDASFDAVFAAWLAEHLDEEEFVTLLREAQRVLKAGGHLILVADLHASKWILRWARRFERLYRRCHVEAVGHVGLRTLAFTRFLLRREGFADVETAAINKSNLLQPVTASWMFDNDLGRQSRLVHAYARAATWIRDRQGFHRVVYAALMEYHRLADRLLPDEYAFTAVLDFAKPRTASPFPPRTAPPPVPLPAAPPPAVDPWSGLEVDPEHARRRAVVVMVDNAPQAFPQRGLAEASVVIQAPLERAHTRLMAVFSRRFPLVGPVRSARPYFIEWAQAFEPFYIYCGASPKAMSELDRPKGLIAVELRYQRDAEGIEFVRNRAVARVDPARKGPHHILADTESIFRAPSSLFLSVPEEHLGLARRDPAQFLEYEPRLAFPFLSGDEAPPGAGSSRRIDVRLWPRCRFAERFTWDAARGGFRRQPLALGLPIPHSHDPEILVRNLVVMFADVEELGASLRRRRRIKTCSEGPARLWRGPHAEEITWHKLAPDLYLEWRDANGRVLALRPGLTWVCVLGPDGEVTERT